MTVACTSAEVDVDAVCDAAIEAATRWYNIDHGTVPGMEAHYACEALVSGDPSYIVHVTPDNGDDSLGCEVYWCDDGWVAEITVWNPDLCERCNP